MVGCLDLELNLLHQGPGKFLVGVAWAIDVLGAAGWQLSNRSFRPHAGLELFVENWVGVEKKSDTALYPWSGSDMGKNL